MTRPVPQTARIGHVHLKVADPERAIGFHSGVLGFEVEQRMGTQAAFLGAGGYHHHIGLNTWESAGGTPPPAGHTGLYHTAILYPDRASLGDAVGTTQNGSARSRCSGRPRPRHAPACQRKRPFPGA